MSEDENRVGQYARRVGEILGLEPETLAMLELAGSLHDVGKDMISERIVDKPGPLTDAEWEEMRKHPELGEEYVREAGHPEDVGDWIRHHHERLDGTGYPDHLEGLRVELQDLAHAPRVLPDAVLALAHAFSLLPLVKR